MPVFYCYNLSNCIKKGVKVLNVAKNSIVYKYLPISLRNLFYEQFLLLYNQLNLGLQFKINMFNENEAIMSLSRF